jgi:hypothetical protein
MGSQFFHVEGLVGELTTRDAPAGSRTREEFYADLAAPVI